MDFLNPGNKRKGLRGVIVSLILWLILSTPVYADIIYTVEEGDSAWSIAVHFSISLEDLYDANGWASDENPVLTPGQRIAVPSDRDDESDSGSDEYSDETTYIVQSGDNPSMIAHRFGISTLALLEYNGLTEEDLIQPGQLLSVPPEDYEYQGTAETATDPEPESEPAPEPDHYRVQTGDTPWGIARSFGLNVQTLLAYNSLDDNSVLQPGDELLIPTDAGSLASRSSAWASYTIAAGDTLGAIAEACGVTSVALAEANNIDRNGTLREGQQLIVPSYRTNPAETEETDEPVPAVHEPEDLSGEVNPLPCLNVTGSTDGLSDDIPGWHSELFDFTQIPPPENSTCEPAPVTEGGLSVDGTWDDGTPYHIYTIRRGDTLGGVAHSFEVTQSDLMERNGLDIRSILRIGRDLKIPLPRPPAPQPSAEPSGSVTWGAPNVNIGVGSGTEQGRSIVQEASKYMGTPYVWGGESLTGGVDCSGFTMSVYSLYGVGLPHRAVEQAECGVGIDYADLQPGDLVFFHTTRSGISHVGMYIGESEFIHSSSYRGGVVISPLDTGYYNDRFVCARRVI